jgi:hypothetical protein
MKSSKPIWEKRYKTKKGGRLRETLVSKGAALLKITNLIYLPSNPDALFDRLDLLLASKHAVNTRLGNELIAVCDELNRLGQLTDDEYKNLNVLINND